MNTENHMVIDISNELERLYGSDERQEREDYERLKSASEKLLNGGSVFYKSYEGIHRGTIGFDEVLQRTYEYTSDVRHPELHDYADCVKEILELYPDSKLSKLVRHMAVVTAADALDIDI